MKGDGGLAGAGAAGDQRGAGRGRPDDLVLLLLDGGDDVAHGVAAGPAEGGHQGAVADDRELLAVQGGGQVGAQQVVLDADHLAALGADHPAADDPARLQRGGAVEGRGGRRPPVDHQGAVLGVQHPEAADVQGLGDGRVGRVERGVGGDAVFLRRVGLLEVDASEEEVLELVVQPLEVCSGPVDLGVALGERAGSADLDALGGVLKDVLGLGELLLQPVVDVVQVLLFPGDLAVADGVDLCALHGLGGCGGVLG